MNTLKVTQVKKRNGRLQKLNINKIKGISHRKWNKLIKIINGNREYKKPIKTKRYFKVVTWNKGNSHFNSNSENFLAIKTELLHQNGDLIILSEAEFNPLDENHIKGEFPNSSSKSSQVTSN